MSWETCLGYLSGLRFVTSDLDIATLLRTMAIVNICNAIMCRIIAGKHGMNRSVWTVAGLVGGVWSVAAVLFLSSARPFGNDEGSG